MKLCHLEGPGQWHGLLKWSVAHTWKKGHRFLGSLQDVLNPFWGIILKIYILRKHNRWYSYTGLFGNLALQSVQNANRRAGESENGNTTFNICRELGKSFNFPMFSHSEMKTLTVLRSSVLRGWNMTGYIQRLTPYTSSFCFPFCSIAFLKLGEKNEWCFLSLLPNRLVRGRSEIPEP